jgi:hypothetical protein
LKEAKTIKAKLSEAGATLDIEWASSCARGRASETAPPRRAVSVWWCDVKRCGSG